MKKIQLTKGQFALVDDEDYERINAHKWCASLDSQANSYYAMRKSLPDENGKRHAISMHREIMGAKPGEHVDHINHDTLDNQKKSNLRLCNRSQNMANRRMHSNNNSGYKGVDWSRSNNAWRARVSVNGKSRFIGYFPTSLDAALAYDKAAIEYHGDHARTNKMMGLLPDNQKRGTK